MAQGCSWNAEGLRVPRLGPEPKILNPISQGPELVEYILGVKL